MELRGHVLLHHH
uniref:Uncharacterized protein n=1 Tax=Rhizophora mucronata TaxID=61149 RepID=A0A2P2QB26_RHIMU